MKKVFLLLSCCAFMAACNSNSSTTNEGAVASTDADSASSASMSAATRQPDADTASMDIGTNRSAGTGGGEVHEKGAQLIASSDCTGCHRIDQKLVGPAYEAVAEKYENNEKDTEYLAGKIIKGGSGVWGQVAMTAHPNLSEEDAKQMAQYILSLKK
ncbi:MULTISPECIES: c-type cytochrome [Rufibacter]|uniref:c-type cytochrome n=1 Tax=Rufibacter TaxID=1379908 RepID=UPI001FEE559A|nr:MULTISPECIES: c-type cytochrome [Rufibacter]